jgi:hypothetical protein
MLALENEKDQGSVEKYAAYITRLAADPKNDWMKNKTEKTMGELYRRVSGEGLVFDGQHITLQKTGISYDYIAYKNKMYLAYPESLVDVGLVFEGDDFGLEKNSGHVLYHHVSKNPFGQSENNIIGGYCVIKNKRGEFITILSKDDLEKHRKIAKTDFIWRQWFLEMATKTIIKKACKIHFSDVYEKIIEEDNHENDIDSPIDIELVWKQEVEAIKALPDLKKYYELNKGRGKDFDKIVTAKKKELTPLPSKTV